ncbi:MAG TPA: hypothetical protein VMZ06_05605 [Candidatus Bathyarchaeia archaeon]|nr:hypothetical protein [Candidatus Bathyarchaeia archaeon]
MDVELMIVPLSEPPLYSSILTFEPGLPEELHVILWLVPRCQDSPPFGEVTVIDGSTVIEKFELLVSLYDEFDVEVTFTL